jgi:hypothetical protein
MNYISDAEIKLELFRIIDHQEGPVLRKIYKSFHTIVKESKKETIESVSDIEEQYKIMSKDIEREKEANEWIEGTQNFDSL